ncbi:MAG: BLUF domain-containing protein [Maribacter sp.]|nr:BLUF domain-containing protein [Maribacter sp.]
MYELAYSSKTPTNLTQVDLSAIQNISGETNLILGITGCLFFHEGDFVGILEGNEKTVKKLFAKIRGDHRHDQIAVLAKGPIEKRQFSQWNMMSCTKGERTPDNAYYNLSVWNILSLSELTEKNTHGSQIFWSTVEESLQGINFRTR